MSDGAKYPALADAVEGLRMLDELDGMIAGMQELGVRLEGDGDLPYDFDLCWDIKTYAEFNRAVLGQTHHDSMEILEMLKAAVEADLPLTTGSASSPAP